MGTINIPDLDACHYANHSKAQYDRVQKLIKPIEINHTSSVLDVGCGFGNIIAEISQMAINGNSIGIDASLNMIELAKREFPKSRFPNLEFHYMKAEDISFPENSFDIVLCTNMLLWVRKAKQALKLMSKCLKKGGLLIILTYPNDTPYAQLFDQVLKKYFFSFSKFSAADTMISEEAHVQTLIQEGINLESVCSKEVLFTYKSQDDLKNYVKGWLNCYVPLPLELQELFLDKVAEESLLFNISNKENEIIIPHRILTIKGRKS